MASIKQFTVAAEEAGFKRTKCVHYDANHHIVYDYPQPLRNGNTGPFYRVHINTAKVPCVVYAAGTGVGNPDKRTTLKAAIEFVRKVGSKA